MGLAPRAMETDEYESRPHRPAYKLRPTLVADLVIPVGGRLSLTTAFLSSAALTAATGILLLVFGLAAAGIFAVFTTAITLASPLTDLLNDNREAIYERAENPWWVNGRTALGLLAIFVGMGIGFTGVALWLGEIAIDQGFGIFVAPVRVDQTLFTQRFGPWHFFFVQNLRVYGAIVVLAFAFRSLGALLVLGWNAARWTSVLTVLTARAMDESNLSSGVFIAGAAAALLPHILLEAAAYSGAGLGAIFLSRALMRYGPFHQRFVQVARATAALLLISLVVLAVASVVEDAWAGAVITWLRGPRP